MKHWPFEALIWVVALAVLAIIDPSAPAISICPLRLLGVEICPGCGLGHSVSWLLHGEIRNSLQSHILGIPTLLVLLHRILSLLFPKAGLQILKTAWAKHKTQIENQQ